MARTDSEYDISSIVPSATDSIVIPTKTTGSTGTTRTSVTSYKGPGAGPVRGKSTKKRTSTSRKSPTTLLDTNITTNFQAMVQQFTGLQPEPPMVYH